ncbi:MAG: SAM-dependent methyltransferase [Thioploca sp.]|nr:SAM-dependent methyltransferase [Thioploca sp.]
MSYSPLPSPSQAALAHSQCLVAQIMQAIKKSGGALPFTEFMTQALYTPGLGYYSAGLRKFGTKGDFVTAPEISPLFSHCIAKQCQPFLAAFDQSVILEFGAGSGVMATEILKALERLNCLPYQYLILEVSAELRQRQQTTLQTQIPKLFNRIHWLDRLPSQPLSGVILANEVLDAMPIYRFRLDEKVVTEFYVSYQDSQFVWQYLPTTNQSLQIAVESLRHQLPVGYISEINLALPAWLQSVADSLLAGLILLIDYGFPQREYYHPQRHQGTLMCHYQHYAHDDPLILIGLQDITAHVNFTAVAEAAIAAGLSVAGYTNQANFLLACGLIELLSALDSNNTPAYLQQAQATKTLILPSEMGELFKVIALTRHWDKPLLGFSRDERIKL